MSAEALAVAAALSYPAFLLAEAALLRRARRRLRLVVHVNGTRGKSETTRLLAAALEAGGRRCLAKTTGTEPRLILPGGGERRLRRLGAADVREQRNLLLMAARVGADCLVAECMAVSPEMQAASTAFLSPDLLLLTNARPDHESELGDTANAARIFAQGVPSGGGVLTADPALVPVLAAAAEERGASLTLSEACRDPRVDAIPENLGLALAAAELAGVPRGLALEGMARHRADPGAFRLRSLESGGGGRVLIVDALAANDPESTESLIASSAETVAKAAKAAEAAVAGAAQAMAGTRERTWLLLATRADRPERSRAFAAWAAGVAGRYQGLLLVGTLSRTVSRGIGLPVERLRAGGVRARLAALPGGSVVHAVGNWKDLGPALAAAAPPLSALEEGR